MSELRHQLVAARSAYLSARYPGDLTELLPSPPMTLVIDHRRGWRAAPWKLAAVLATAATFGVLLCLPPSVGDDRPVYSYVPSLPPLPQVPSLNWVMPATDVIPAIDPRQADAAWSSIDPSAMASEFLAAVKEPLETSEKLIVAIGKDIAQRADELLGIG